MNLATEWVNKIRNNWREAFSDTLFKKLFWANFIICFICFFAVLSWLRINSTRNGTIVNDPVYRYLTPHDFSWPIFTLTYSSAILLILNMIPYPKVLHRAFTAFLAMFVMRAICIYLIPLSPSPDLIPLNDPYSDAVAGENQIYNDLFFSGHIADLSFFYLLTRSAWLKRFLLFCIVAVGTMLVWQRIHYTLDVVAAPFFAYLTYWVFIEKDFIWSPVLKKQLCE